MRCIAALYLLSCIVIVVVIAIFITILSYFVIVIFSYIIIVISVIVILVDGCGWYGKYGLFGEKIIG